MNKSLLPLRKLVPALLALTLLTVAHIASAQQLEYNKGFDDEPKEWIELQAELPPAPKAENLQPFYVGPTATQQFAIDTKSLAIGKDGVIRYTLVAVSQGAPKISATKAYAAPASRKRFMHWGAKTVRGRHRAAICGSPSCVARSIASMQHWRRITFAAI